MTADQQAQLLGSVGALCRALGADLQPDESPNKQAAHGLAFVLARAFKKPESINGLAALACRDYVGAGE